MSNYKQEITLNEKDSLKDALLMEKQLLKTYATAITEGCSEGFRAVVKENFNDATQSQFEVFLQMTEHDYYRVHSAPEHQTQKARESFMTAYKEIID